MRIRFQSRHGLLRTSIAQIRNSEYANWYDGEEKDVPDDLLVSVAAAGQRAVQAKAVDAILLAGPDFVDAATGKHPDFTCVACGRESLSRSYMGYRNGTQTMIDYENADGAKLCVRDYLLSQPPSAFAWRAHRAVEYSQGLEEADAVLAARARGEKDDLPVLPAETPAQAIAPTPVPPPPLPVIAAREEET